MNELQREVVDHLFWGFEALSGYWFQGELTCDDAERHGDRVERCTACRWDGVDAEDGSTRLTVTFLTLLEGLKRLASEDHDWHDKEWPAQAKSAILALNGTPVTDEDDDTDWSNTDAEWCDVVAQLGLFGDVVYG